MHFDSSVYIFNPGSSAALCTFLTVTAFGLTELGQGRGEIAAAFSSLLTLPSGVEKTASLGFEMRRLGEGSRRGGGRGKRLPTVSRLYPRTMLWEVAVPPVGNVCMCVLLLFLRSAESGKGGGGGVGGRTLTGLGRGRHANLPSVAGRHRAAWCTCWLFLPGHGAPRWAPLILKYLTVRLPVGPEGGEEAQTEGNGSRLQSILENSLPLPGSAAQRQGQGLAGKVFQVQPTPPPKGRDPRKLLPKGLA